MKTATKLLVAAILCATPIYAQSPVENPKFKAAESYIDRDPERLVHQIIQLTEIEAPSFKEEKRAAAFVQLLKQSGLSNVETDAAGNVLGLRKGIANGPMVAIAAHLDTVFPEGTNVKVKQQGTRLMAPGIGDDTRCLSALLEIIRALDAAQIQTKGDILFVADVGEEGLGDLRGMKYLFEKGPYKDRIKMFISMDGSGPGSSITRTALPSKRYRVTFKGPGGHSYGSFGIVNPAYAMAKAIDRLSRMQVPSDPRTTFNVGVVSGGTSVNSIPNEVEMEVDMRSESGEELAKEAETFLGLMHDAVDEENRARSTEQGKITLDVKVIGDRPAGETPITSPMLRSATAVVSDFGMIPSFDIGSTDSNVPMSLKIPAITIDCGGTGGRAHALDEWIDVEKSGDVKGIDVAMGILLSLAGIP